MRKRFIFYDEEKQLAMIKDLCRLRERRDNGSTNIVEDQQVCQTENDIFMNTDRHFDLRHFSSLPVLPTKIENDCEGFKYGKRHGTKLVTPVTFDDVREWRTLTTAKGNNRCWVRMRHNVDTCDSHLNWCSMFSQNRMLLFTTNVCQSELDRFHYLLFLFQGTGNVNKLKCRSMQNKKNSKSRIEEMSFTLSCQNRKQNSDVQFWPFVVKSSKNVFHLSYNLFQMSRCLSHWKSSVLNVKKTYLPKAAWFQASVSYSSYLNNRFLVVCH